MHTAGYTLADLKAIIRDPRYSADTKVLALETAYAMGQRDLQQQHCLELAAKVAA